MCDVDLNNISYHTSMSGIWKNIALLLLLCHTHPFRIVFTVSYVTTQKLAPYHVTKQLSL